MRGWRRSPLCYSHIWVPSSDRPINGGEEKYGWRTRCQQKIRFTAIGDGTGWCACRRFLVIRIGRRDGDDQRLLGACSVVQRTEPCPFVRDPPWAARGSGPTPRVYQLRIGDRGTSCRVGNKVGLGVVLRKASGAHDQSPCCTRARAQ